MYHDSEHTEQILWEDDLEIGKKVYYEIISEEAGGCYVSQLSYDSRGFSSITDEYFVLSDKSYISSLDIRDICAGDFNRDNRLDLKDVALIIRYCAGLKEFDDKNFRYEYHFDWGDYNRDDEIDHSDVAALIRVLAGLEERYGGVQTDFELHDIAPLAVPTE